MGTQDEISVKGYNQWSRHYRIAEDDGDGLPTGLDAYRNRKTDKPVPFTQAASDVIDYYRDKDPKSISVDDRGDTHVTLGNQRVFFFRDWRKSKFPRCGYGWDYQSSEGYTKYREFSCSSSKNDSWLLGVNRLIDLASESYPSISRYYSKGPKVAYGLATYFAYQPEDQTDRLISFLETSTIYPLALQKMERTAKARGNVALGGRIHEIFESREPGEEFTKINIKDDWGDTIYLEKDSPSEKSWQIAKGKLDTVEDRRDFARALAYFDAVTIEENVSKAALLGFARDVPKLYARGIPTPRFLKIREKGVDTPIYLNPPEQIPDDKKVYSEGKYIRWRDGITMTQWSTYAYVHELGHFLSDLMDDEKGPNDSHYLPTFSDGRLVFDPKRCNILESVSEYGGRCDSERKGGTSKAHEDLAETFSWVIQSHDEEFPCKALPWGNLVETTLQIIENSVEVYLKVLKLDAPSDLVGNEPGNNLVKELRDTWVKSLYQKLKNSVEKPPEHQGSDKEYLKSLRIWIRQIKNDVVKPAYPIRIQKLQWMTEVLQQLSPGQNQPKRPNVEIAPWEIPSQIKGEFNPDQTSEPKDAAGYDNRGLERAKLGVCYAAIEDFTKAITLDPKYGKAYYNRGLVRDKLGMALEAQQDFEKAQELTKTAEKQSRSGLLPDLLGFGVIYLINQTREEDSSHKADLRISATASKSLFNFDDRKQLSLQIELGYGSRETLDTSGEINYTSTKDRKSFFQAGVGAGYNFHLRADISGAPISEGWFFQYGLSIGERFSDSFGMSISVRMAHEIDDLKEATLMFGANLLYRP